MRQDQARIGVKTNGIGLYDVTHPVERFVMDAGLEHGMLTVFCQHTSCSLIVQENADPDVQVDLKGFFARLAPEGMDWLTHTTEGPDDMPAHIRTALTQSSLSIPVSGGRMTLGTWQGIYLFEHRRAPHRRNLVLHIVGDDA